MRTFIYKSENEVSLLHLDRADLGLKTVSSDGSSQLTRSPSFSSNNNFLLPTEPAIGRKTNISDEDFVILKKCFEENKSSFPLENNTLIYPIIKTNVPVPHQPEGYAFNFNQQQSDIENFFKGKSSEGWATRELEFKVFSRKQSTYPPVVVYLHGSSGDDDYHPFIEEVLNRGMAYVSFNRFGTSATSRPEKSWERQTELPLSSEIMMVYSVCRKLVELGTTEIHLMGHSRGGTIVMECAKECNAKYFRDACKVKSYTPILAMSLYTGIMTSFEPVTLFMAGAILFVLMTL